MVIYLLHIGFILLKRSVENRSLTYKESMSKDLLFPIIIFLVVKWVSVPVSVPVLKYVLT